MFAVCCFRHPIPIKRLWNDAATKPTPISAGDLVNWARGWTKWASNGAARFKGHPERLVCRGNPPMIRQRYQNILSTVWFCRIFIARRRNLRRPLAVLGYSTPTPFDRRSKMTEEQMRRTSKIRGLHPRFGVPFAAPCNTALDRIAKGCNAAARRSASSLSNRARRIFFCGHIHEAEGVLISQIGNGRGDERAIRAIA